MEFILILVYIAMCMHVGYLAALRGRSAWIWSAVTFFVGIFGYVVLLLPSKR